MPSDRGGSAHLICGVQHRARLRGSFRNSHHRKASSSARHAPHNLQHGKPKSRLRRTAIPRSSPSIARSRASAKGAEKGLIGNDSSVRLSGPLAGDRDFPGVLLTNVWVTRHNPSKRRSRGLAITPLGHATRNPGLASGFRGATVGWAIERLVSDGRGAMGGTVGGTSAQRRAAGDRLRR
jgi:hypothetical protein